MGFAEDKVYNHILRNMSRFCDIHVASLVDSLSCLTDADRPPERKSPQLPLMKSMVCDGKEKPLPYPTNEQQEAVENPGTSSTVLPSVSPEQGQEWLSHRHPVCVDNGCFGNANHLQRGMPNLDLSRSLPPRDLSAAPGPEQTRNEPQEDVYVSTELPVRLVETAGGGGLQPPSSLRTQEERAVHTFKHDGPPSSFVDVRNPLLIQQQFDAEQKQIEREHEGGGDALKETTTSVSTSAPRDVSPFCDTSLKPPVGERMLPVEEAASSTPSMPGKEKVLSASVASLSGMNAAGSFEGAAGRTPSRVSSAASIWASHDNEEEDVELSKPGALQSVVGESPKAAARYQQSPSSNTSSHLGLSSDPLMVSTDSLRPGEAQSTANSGRWSATPAVHADPGGEKAAGVSPYPPLSWGSPSVGTHEVHVEHHPSAMLAAGNDVPHEAVPYGDSPDSNKGSNATNSSSHTKVPTSGDSSGPSLLYVLPAVGIALISVFLVYKRLQK
ncbi:hypothetical protein CIB84_005639 [Bambusicola thoracicus]|uniref:Caspase recruitment domain-containing protein n=1 Tax=Bambusicola thoracicus TaxID=9083 RepID=A0A2P4T2L9_BAMTH|nr:hypothetical protein CIB84_005639 [Bambusicola thoracicus]